MYLLLVLLLFILGELAKLRKTPITIVMSVRMSVTPLGTIRFPLTGFP